MTRIMRVLTFVLCLLYLDCPAMAQTGATGALKGTVSDVSDAAVPQAAVKVTSIATGEIRSVRTQDDGSFSVPLLPPGEYVVEVAKDGFRTLTRSGLEVKVTETTTVALQLEVGGVTDVVEVTARGEIVQTQSSTLGRVVDSRVVQSLPLVTRNFTQIIGLSPGVTTNLTDAGEIGRGSGSTSAGGTSAHGNREYDNNFQLNGLGVNDIFQQGSAPRTPGSAHPPGAWPTLRRWPRAAGFRSGAAGSVGRDPPMASRAGGDQQENTRLLSVSCGIYS